MRRLTLVFVLAMITTIFVAPAAAADSGVAAARIASAENRVETQKAGAAPWTASVPNQALYGKDRVRTGPASRAAILYSDQTLHRLNEKSEVEILPPSAGAPGLLKVLTGQHYFSSRTPKEYGRIETPTVTAAIRGTEFVVDVADDLTTRITMLEGVVHASNEHGAVEVREGEQAYVEPGKAPQKRIVVRPRDAAAWAFYYPPVLAESDASRLEEMGADGEALSRAARMLGAGQVEAAAPLIREVHSRRQDDPIALALASVIEMAADRVDEATRLAEAAVAADRNSPAAALALSFAAQASFDIGRAREMAETAARLDPKSPVALARAAELRMAEGDLDGARQAAQAAVDRAPGEARALAVLGFVDLAEFRTREAEATFERAILADPGLALARLGHGIALYRGGRLEEGFGELQTAVALDPADSLARSYLGKAYYEERRTAEASKELAAAKRLDPNDPTPYLYDAILKQNDNRPIEALADLRQSVAKNDGRAVYRSRLLLDEDRAVRATDLARIYNDLGFESLGLVTARRSADQDQANASSHHFLAGNYRSLPGFASSFLSEALQARIYQPTSVNAARPDSVNESVSFNEYSALLDRPRSRAFGDLAYGATDTGLGSLIPPGLCFTPSGSQVPCADLTENDESDVASGSAVGTSNGDRYATALGFEKFDDDGFRQNADQRTANYRGFFQFSPTHADSIQISALYGRQETGDLPIRQSPALMASERFETLLTNVGVGYHRKLGPGADLAISAIYNETEQTGFNTASGGSATGTLSGPQLEGQSVVRRPGATWIFGLGAFDGTQKLEGSGSVLESDDIFRNGYALVKLRGSGPLEITAGISVEQVVAPVGIVLPRDANFFPAGLEFEETEVSPKLGAALYLPSKTTLRAAVYYRLTPTLGRVQTLEPTQVAGFNQFFEDPGGTRSLSWGVGIDQEFARWLYAGGSYQKRDLKIPQAYCDFEDPFSGCGFQTVTQVVERDSDDDYWNGYMYATLGNRLALGVDYQRDQHDFDTTSISPVGLFQDFMRTERIRPQLRLHFPFGLFFGASGTRYDQEVDQFDDLTSSVRNTVESTFWIGDVFLGCRFPKRYGSVVLEAKNVADREFTFFERSVQDRVVPTRSVKLTLSLTY